MSLVAQLLTGFQAIKTDMKTWFRIKNTKATLIASSQSVGTNADHNWLVLNIPANTLQVGDTLDFNFLGAFTHGTFGSGNLNFWTKWNTTKTQNLAQGFTAITFSNRPFFFRGQATVRSVGTSAILEVAYNVQLDGITQVSLLPVQVTINTTIANTFTVGCNVSVTGAANVTYAEVGSIRLLW